MEAVVTNEVNEVNEAYDIHYDNATFKAAVCHRCGGPATTTQRLVDGRPAPYSGETIVVGELDSYEARCRDCHEPGATAQAVAAA
jgi:thymidine kinase